MTGLGRRITLPILAILLAALLAFLTYSAWSELQRLQTLERQRNLLVAASLDAELRSLATLTKSIATSLATNPEIQSSFYVDNRNRMAQLSLEPYNQLKGLIDLSQAAFYKPPAQLFLNLEGYDPKLEQQESGPAHQAATLANESGSLSSGIELGPDGLVMRGAAPISYRNNPLGAIEFSARLDQLFLNTLKEQTSQESDLDWQILLLRQAAEAGGLPVKEPAPDELQPPESALFLQASTLASPFYATQAAYQQGLAGETSTSQIQAGDRSLAITSAPLRNATGEVIGVIDIIADRSLLAAQIQQQMVNMAIFAGLCFVIAGLSAGALIQQRLSPLRSLNRAAVAVAQGDLNRRIPVSPQSGTASPGDELQELAASFSTITNQLRRLAGSLDEQVETRTRMLERRLHQLQAASEVTHQAVSLSASRSVPGVQTNPGADQEPGETLISGSALEDLLQRSAQTMIDRFQFYFTGIYLTEEDPDTVATATGTLVLKAACLDGQRGAEIGQRIAAKGRRVLVEGPNPLQARRGAVAVAASSKRPRLSLDVSLDPLFSPDPDLPETRSQICLPLLIGSKVIGVLDIQTRAGSLSSEEVPILQNLADELAAAIQNIHLAEQVGQANQEIQQAYGRFTQQAWRTLTGARMGTGEPGDAANALGFRASQQSGSLSPIFAGEIAAASQPESLAFADQPGAQSGDLAYLENVQVRLAEDGATLLSVPVKVRQQAIAMIELRFASTTSETAGSPRVSEETLATLNDVAARLGLVLESGRLLQEAQRLAAREQQINLISTQMRGASKLESILQTTVRELGKALGASRAVIQLREEGRHE